MKNSHRADQGGFGGCSPGTKTGTRVRSPKPHYLSNLGMLHLLGTLLLRFLCGRSSPLSKMPLEDLVGVWSLHDGDIIGPNFYNSSAHGADADLVTLRPKMITQITRKQFFVYNRRVCNRQINSHRRALNGTCLMARARKSEKQQKTVKNCKKLRKTARPKLWSFLGKSEKQQETAKTCKKLPAVSCVYH